MVYPVGYNMLMDIIETEQYDKWFHKIKDRNAKARINIHLTKCQLEGQLVGDIKPIGKGVNELRFHFGPGYRIYFAQKGTLLVLLLAGGDKSSQQHDIRTAQHLLDQLIKEEKW